MSEELVGGEEERKGGQILGASDITLRGLNQRKNVSLNDGLRILFLSMVQGGRSPSAPDGFLPGRGGDKVRAEFVIKLKVKVRFRVSFEDRFRV